MDEFGVEFLGELLEGFSDGGDTSRALAVVGGFSAAPSEGVGDGDCFLVDIESDGVGIARGERK